MLLVPLRCLSPWWTHFPSPRPVTPHNCVSCPYLLYPTLPPSPVQLFPLPGSQTNERFSSPFGGCTEVDSSISRLEILLVVLESPSSPTTYETDCLLSPWVTSTSLPLFPGLVLSTFVLEVSVLFYPLTSFGPSEYQR